MGRKGSRDKGIQYQGDPVSRGSRVKKLEGQEDRGSRGSRVEGGQGDVGSGGLQVSNLNIFIYLSRVILLQNNTR